MLRNREIFGAISAVLMLPAGEVVWVSELGYLCLDYSKTLIKSSVLVATTNKCHADYQSGTLGKERSVSFNCSRYATAISAFACSTRSIWSVSPQSCLEWIKAPIERQVLILLFRAVIAQQPHGLSDL